jgi:hypothetical protein
MNRRSFLAKAGLASAAAATTGLIPPTASANAGPGVAPGAADPNPNGAFAEGELFKAAPTDHGGALINPDMGWTLHFYSNIPSNYGSKLEASDTVDDFPGLSTVYLRLPWAFIEPEEGKFDWETLDTPAQRWIDKGKKVALRITSMESWMQKATPQWVFDAGATSYGVDNDRLVEPEYDDPIFLEKVENFVRAMAARYDGNPNVAFVDIGHFGMWGEGHTIPTTPLHGVSWGLETQKKHIDIYCRHFKKTLLCVSDDYAGPFLRGDRFPILDYALSRGVTLRDDSILVMEPPDHWFHSEVAQLFWPTMPVILEHEHYGISLGRGRWIDDKLVESVEAYHASYMSIHWWPRELLEACRDAIDRINRRMGYRLRVNEVVWPKEVKTGEEFVVESGWSNAGVAPCLKGGHVCFTLKDKQGGIAAVLVDSSFDVKHLSVAEPEQADSRRLTSRFRVAPKFTDRSGEFFRAFEPGTLDLFVSVGQQDGTPLYELPYPGNDGKKRYKLGEITVVDDGRIHSPKPY